MIERGKIGKEESIPSYLDVLQIPILIYVNAHGLNLFQD